jgi:DNA repair protein RecO (recombination protein O)
MERQRQLLQPGFVLHSRPYGDTSALLEVFGAESGRVGLVARGVRGPRSKRRGLLQPFNELLLSWQGRGELGTLADVESRGAPVFLAGGALISGFYLNELLMRLLRRDDPHPEVYSAYRGAVAALAAGEPQAPLLRVFEKRLLEGLGYGLMLGEDRLGDPVRADAHYRYLPEEGPEPVAAAQPGHTVEGVLLLRLAAEKAHPSLADPALARLLRQALAPYIGERPLKSRELYRQFLHSQPHPEGKPHHDQR